MQKWINIDKILVNAQKKQQEHYMSYNMYSNVHFFSNFEKLKSHTHERIREVQ